MDKITRRFERQILCFAVLLIGCAKSSPKLTITPGSCGDVTVLNCSSTDIDLQDPFKFYYNDSGLISFYDHTTTAGNKHNVTANNGSFVLYIYDTNNTDAKNYVCEHNFLRSNSVNLEVSCPQSGLTLTVVSDGCSGVTALNCSSNDISITDSYKWDVLLPNRTSIYDHTASGGPKYNGTIQNGSLILQIYNVTVADVNQYVCNHNFRDSNIVALHLACTHTGNNDNSDSPLVTVVTPVVVILAVLVILILMYFIGLCNPLLRKLRWRRFMKRNPAFCKHTDTSVLPVESTIHRSDPIQSEPPSGVQITDTASSSAFTNYPPIPPIPPYIESGQSGDTPQREMLPGRSL